MGIRSFLPVSGVVKGVYPVGGNGLLRASQRVSRGRLMLILQGRDGSPRRPVGSVCIVKVN